MADKVRIVYLNPCGKLGGAETSLRELLASLRAAEPTWELCLVLAEDGPLAEIAREMGVTVIMKPFPPALGRLGDAGGLSNIWSLAKAAAATFRYARQLAQLLGELQPDLIHTNGFKMHLLGAWTRPRGVPLIWHIHDYVSARRSMSRLLRAFQKACSAAIANSKSVAADLRELLPDLNVVPIYNAIDLDRFSPRGSKLDLDTIAGLPAAGAGTARVGLVATFARWKGHGVFLQALAQLPEEPVRGYIIGGPIYQTDKSQCSLEELKKEAARLGLGDRVGFTGFIPDPAEAMRSLDVVVHASTAPEPFGMVIIEAMACERAVIASQAGGAAELFTDGENALGHLPGDAAGLARQIQRLVVDPELRLRLGRAARQTSQQYQKARLAQELTAVYRAVSRIPTAPSTGAPEETFAGAASNQ